MTYVVDEGCIKCKHMDCVDVCPVDCFYEGENMLVIHPDECIDCGVCEPECPIEAIHSDTEEGMERWINLMIGGVDSDGEEILKVIEVQVGDVLSEDDIIRYEDRYDRN